MLDNTLYLKANEQTVVLSMCSTTNLYHPDVLLFMILSGWWADSSPPTYTYIYIYIGPSYSNPSLSVHSYQCYEYDDFNND